MVELQMKHTGYMFLYFVIFFQVKLTLQKLAVQAIPRPGLVKKNNAVNEDLVKLVSGERVHQVSPALHGLPHLTMYLTLDAKSDNHKSHAKVSLKLNRHLQFLVLFIEKHISYSVNCFERWPLMP